MDEHSEVGEYSEIVKAEEDCDGDVVRGVISAQRDKIMKIRRLKRSLSTEIKGLNKLTITMKRQPSFGDKLQYPDIKKNENKFPKQTYTKLPKSSSEIRPTFLVKNINYKQKPLTETKQFRCEDEQRSLMDIEAPDIHHNMRKYKPGPKSKRKLLNGGDDGPKIKSCSKSQDKVREYITLQQLLDHCLKRYYRLKSANWECSSDAALKLLTKKYNSLKLLFSRTPVLQLKRVQSKIHRSVPPVKLNNEDKGSKHNISMEFDENKICNSSTQIKSVNSLVDPRVMSMSKALQSSNSGKVGIEKTFKSAPTLKKVKKDIKTKETGKKPLMSRPDWSKFKEKLKEANSRLISKKKDGLVIGKTLGNLSFYTNNTSSSLPTAPFVQAKVPQFRIPKKVADTEPPSDSKLTKGLTTDKQKEQETSKHDNIFDRFKCDNLAESKSNGAKKTIENFVLDGYTIEITRDSPVDVTMQEVSDDEGIAPETDMECNASLQTEEVPIKIKHETITVEESDENGIVDIEDVSDETHPTESVENKCVETSKSNSGNCMSVSSLNIEGRNVVEIEDEQSSYEVSDTDKDKSNPKDDINATLHKMLHHIEHFGTDVNAVDDIVSCVLDDALQNVEDYSEPDLQSKVSLKHPSKLEKRTNSNENKSQICQCSCRNDKVERQQNEKNVVKCLCEINTGENNKKEHTRCNGHNDFVLNKEKDHSRKCNTCAEDDVIIVEEGLTKKDCKCRNISALNSTKSNSLTPNASSFSGHMNTEKQHCFHCKGAANKISGNTHSSHDKSRDNIKKFTSEKCVPSLKVIKPKFVNTFVEMAETDSSAAKSEISAEPVIVEDSETEDDIESDFDSGDEVSTKLMCINENTTAETKTSTMPTKEAINDVQTLEPTAAPTCNIPQGKDNERKGRPYSDVSDEEESKQGAMDCSAQRLMQEDAKQGAMDRSAQRLMQGEGKPETMDSSAQRLMKEEGKPGAVDSDAQRLMQEFPKHNWLFTKYQNSLIRDAPSSRGSSHGGAGLTKAKNTTHSKKKQEMKVQKCSKDKVGENIKTLQNRSTKYSSRSDMSSDSAVCGDDSVVIKVSSSKATSRSNGRTAISKTGHLDNVGTLKSKQGSNCVSQLQEEHEIPPGYTKQSVQKENVQSHKSTCNKSFMDTYNEFIKRTTSNNMNDDEMKELIDAKEDAGKVPVSENLATLDAGIQERCKDPVLAEMSPITAPFDEWNETADDFQNESSDAPEDLEEKGNILEDSLDSFSEIKQEPLDIGFKDVTDVFMDETNKMSWNSGSYSELCDDDDDDDDDETDDEDLQGKRLQIDETAESTESSLFSSTDTSMSEVATSSEANSAPALSWSATHTDLSLRSPSSSAVFSSPAWISPGLCSPTASFSTSVQGAPLNGALSMSFSKDMLISTASCTPVMCASTAEPQPLLTLSTSESLTTSALTSDLASSNCELLSVNMPEMIKSCPSSVQTSARYCSATSTCSSLMLSSLACSENSAAATSRSSSPGSVSADMPVHSPIALTSVCGSANDSSVDTCKAIVTSSMAEPVVTEDSNKSLELSLQKSETSSISFRQKPRPPVQLVYPMHKPDFSMAPNMPAITMAMVSATMDTGMATYEESSQPVLSSIPQPVTMVNVPYTSPSLPAIPLYMGMVVPLQQFVQGSQAFIPQAAARPSISQAARPSISQAEFGQGMTNSIRTAQGSELPTTNTSGIISYPTKRGLDVTKTAVDKAPKYCTSVSKSVTTYRNIQPKVMTSTQSKGPPPLIRISDSKFTIPAQQEAPFSMVSMHHNVNSELNMAQTKVGISASDEAHYTDPISKENTKETVYEADLDQTNENDDEIDEDFKKQMEEIDQEIKRKEKEQAEMRRKRLELMERAKQEKMKIKSTNLAQKSTCFKAEESESTVTTKQENVDCKQGGSFIMSNTLSANPKFRTSDDCSSQADVQQPGMPMEIDTGNCKEEIKPEKQFEEPNHITVKTGTWAKKESYEHQEKNSLDMKMIDTKLTEMETYRQIDEPVSTENEINNKEMKMDKMETDHNLTMEKGRVDNKSSVTELKGTQSDINKQAENSDETTTGPPRQFEEEAVDLSSASADFNKSALDSLPSNAARLKSCIESTYTNNFDEKYEKVDEQVKCIEDIRKINPFTGESEALEINNDTIEIFDDTDVETEKQSSDSEVNHSKRKQDHSFEASTSINENMCLDLSKGRSTGKEKAASAEHVMNNNNQPIISTSDVVVESSAMVDGSSMQIQSQTGSDSQFVGKNAMNDSYIDKDEAELNKNSSKHDNANTAMAITSSSSKTSNDVNVICEFPGEEDLDFIDLTIDKESTKLKDKGSSEHKDTKKKAEGSRRNNRRNRTLKELQEEAIQQLEQRKKNDIYDFDNLTVEDLSYTKNPNYFPKTSHVARSLNMCTMSRKRSNVLENDFSGKSNATEGTEPKDAHTSRLLSPPRKKPKSAPVSAHTQNVETSKLLDVLSKCENPSFPINTAQLCTLTSRKTPCFLNPRETIRMIKPREKRVPKPAHSQKPFGIAGQLISWPSRGSHKRSLPRSSLQSEVSIRTSSLPNEKVHSKQTVDEQTDMSPFPSHCPPHLKSDRSPIKAHQPPYGIPGKHHITRVLRPPPCVELYAYGVNRDLSGNQSIEKALQDELSSALGKGQRSERSEGHGNQSQVRNVTPDDATYSGSFSRPSQSPLEAYQQYSHGASPDETLRYSVPVESSSQSPACQHIRYDYAGKPAPVSPAECDLSSRRDVHADRRMQDASPQGTYRGQIHNLLLGEQPSNRFSNQTASTHMLPPSQHANQQMQVGPYPNTQQQQQQPPFPPPPYAKSQPTAQYPMPGMMSQSAGNQAFDVNSSATRMMRPRITSIQTIPMPQNSSMPMMQMNKKASSQLMQSPQNPNTQMMQMPYNQNTPMMQMTQNTHSGMMQMNKQPNPQMMQMSKNATPPNLMINKMPNPMMQMPQTMGNQYTQNNPAGHRMQMNANSNSCMMQMPSNANIQGGQAQQQMMPVYKPRIQGQPFRPGMPSNRPRASMFSGGNIGQVLTDDERVFTMQQIRAKHIRTQQANMNQSPGIQQANMNQSTGIGDRMGALSANMNQTPAIEDRMGALSANMNQSPDRMGALSHMQGAMKSSEAEQQTGHKTSQEGGGYQSYPISPRPAGMGSNPYVVSSQMNSVPIPSNMSASHSQPSNSLSRLPSEQQTTYSSPLTSNTGHTNNPSQVCIPQVSMDTYPHRWGGAGVQMSPTQSQISPRNNAAQNLSPSDRGYSGAEKLTKLSPIAPSPALMPGPVPSYPISSCDQQYPNARQQHQGSSHNYTSATMSKYTATPLYENNAFQNMTNTDQFSLQQYNRNKDYRSVAMDSYESTQNSQQPPNRSHFSQPHSGLPSNIPPSNAVHQPGHINSSQQAYQLFAISQPQAQNYSDCSSTGPHGPLRGQAGYRPVYDSVSPIPEQDHHFQGYPQAPSCQFHDQHGYSHLQSPSTGSQRFMPYHSARGHDPAQAVTVGKDGVVKVRRGRQKNAKKNTVALKETGDHVQDLSKKKKKVSDKVDTEMSNESTGNTEHILTGNKSDINDISQDDNQKESVVQTNKENRPVTQTTSSIHQDMESNSSMESTVINKISEASNTTYVSEEKNQSNSQNQNSITVGSVDGGFMARNKTVTQTNKPRVTSLSRRTDDNVIIFEREKERGSPWVSEGGGPVVSKGRGHQMSDGGTPQMSEGGGPVVSKGRGHQMSDGGTPQVSEGGGPEVSKGRGHQMSEGGTPQLSEGGGPVVSKGRGHRMSDGGTPQVSEGGGPGVSNGRGHRMSNGRTPQVSEGGGPGVSKGRGHRMSDGGTPQVSEGRGPGVSKGRGHRMSDGGTPQVSEVGGPGVSKGRGHRMSDGGTPHAAEGVGLRVSEGGGPQEGPGASEVGDPRVSEGDDMDENTPHLQQIHGRCVLCSKYALYLCSSCKKIWYCSPHCQLAHWQAHSSECGI